MELSIKEAAIILGKSPRTIRRMVKTGRIPGRQEGRRWFIERKALAAVSPDEVDARREKVEDLRGRINDVLEEVAGPVVPGEKNRGFYSVRDMVTYRVAASLVADLDRLTEEDHSDSAALREAHTALCHFLRLLTDACHQFHPHIKINRLVDARTQACTALAELLRFNISHEVPNLTPMVDQLERDLLGSLRGLLRRAEKRARLSPRP